MQLNLTAPNRPDLVHVRPSGPTDCVLLLLHAGLSCVASAQCKLLQCSPNNGTYAEPCFGLCTPSKRSIVGAKLENDGRTITISLNTPAAEAQFPCDQLFSAPTVARLGGAASCSVAGSVLTVSTARDATILPQDGGAFGPDSVTLGQKVLRDAFVNATFTPPTSNVTLTSCDSCAGPAVTVCGPQVSSMGASAGL